LRLDVEVAHRVVHGIGVDARHPQLVGKNSVPMNEPHPGVERVRRARIRPVIQLVEFQLDLAIEIIVIRRVAGRVLEQIGGRGTSLS
jgi:hypothetical protein